MKRAMTDSMLIKEYVATEQKVITSKKKKLTSRLNTTSSRRIFSFWALPIYDYEAALT